MHLVYSDAHLKYTDIVYTKRINEVYAVAHTIVLQPLLHSVKVGNKCAHICAMDPKELNHR